MYQNILSNMKKSMRNVLNFIQSAGRVIIDLCSRKCWHGSFIVDNLQLDSL